MMFLFPFPMHTNDHRIYPFVTAAESFMELPAELLMKSFSTNTTWLNPPST